MAMVLLRGSRRRYWIAPLLIALAIGRQSAAAPSSPENAYRVTRAAFDRGESAEVGLRRVDAALAAMAGRNDAAVWELKMLRAELLRQVGRPKESDDILKEELPAPLQNSAAAVLRLLQLTRRDPNDAAKHLTAALAIAARHQPQLLALVMMNEINYVKKTEELEAAAKEAILLARKYSDVATEAKLHLAYAYKLFQNAQWTEGLPWAEKALQIAQQHKLIPALANIEGNLGWAYSELGDLDAAQEFYRRADASNERQNLQHARLQWMNNIGNLYYFRRQYAKAREQYLRTLDVAQRVDSKSHISHALANVGVNALEMGLYDVARRYNTEALRQKRELKDTTGILNSLITDARLDAVAGRNEDAVKALESVIAEAGKENAHKPIQWDALGRVAQVYATMKKDDLAEARFRRALATVGEARATIKSLEPQLSFLTNAADVLSSYLDFLISRGRITEALAATETYRAQTLEKGLRVSDRASQLDPREAARESNATILCYWLSPRQSYLWSITPKDIKLHKLAADSKINTAVDRYEQELLGGMTAPRTSRTAQDLYKLLVEPAGAIGKDGLVIIVPDGRLHALNFETLLVPGSPARYWIEDVVLTTAGSLQLLARTTKKTPAAPTMLLIGDPPRPDPVFPVLPHAQREMALVAKHFQNPVVLSGPKATPAGFDAAKAGQFDYLHFVAHGVAVRQKPLDSAVILGRDQGTSNYRLTARDIIKTQLRARLVTISSCHGAGTRTYVGEGLIGLAWAFLRAGADQVVAALWEVNDKAAPDLMDSMYAGIQAGKPPAVALRDAKLKLLRSGKIYQNPIYWAPFILYSGS